MSGNRTSHTISRKHLQPPSLFTVLPSLIVPIVLCGIVVPILLAFAGGAVIRLVYPAYAFLVGFAFFNHRRNAYPGFCIALFAMTPLVRRVVDYSAGFSDFNLVLLAPYVALLPCVLPLLRQSVTRRPQALPFQLLLLSVVYGAFLALLQARVVPAFYESLRWILPVALTAFILENHAIVDRIRISLTGTLAILVPLISAYGVAQYFNPQPWDIIWLQNVMEAGATSFGRPEAYQIRVFATLNSPGSFAMFLATAIPLLLAEGGLIALVGLTGLPALALSIVRGGWVACAIGVLVTFVVARGGKKLGLLAVGLGIGFLGVTLAGSVQLAPEAVSGLTERFSTFSSMGNDGSAQDRLDTYGTFFTRLGDSPLGEGFGANAGMSSASEKRDLLSLDSGILEVFITFGPIVGTLYFIGFGILIVLSYNALRESGGRLPGHFGIVCALVAVLPLGSNQIGELGIITWAALGVLLATAEQQHFRAAARLQQEKAGRVSA